MYNLEEEAAKIRAARAPAAKPVAAKPAPVAKPVVVAAPAPVLDKAKAHARLVKIEAAAKALLTPNLGANEAVAEVRKLLVDSADFSAAVEAGNLAEADRIDRVLKARGPMTVVQRIAAINGRLARAEGYVTAQAATEVEARNERERKERLIARRSGPRGRW